MGENTIAKTYLCPKMLSLGPGLGYRCYDCEFKSPKKDDLRHHIESSHLNLSYNCQLSGKAYKSYKGRFHLIHLENSFLISKSMAIYLIDPETINTTLSPFGEQE